MHRSESKAKAAEPTDTPARWQPRGHVVMVIRLLAGRVGGAERLFCDVASLLADAGFEVTIVYCDSRQAPIAYALSPKVSRINLWAKAARRAPWYLALDAAARGYPKLGALAPVEWLSSNLYFLRRLHAVARGLRPDVMISFLPPANTLTLLAGWMAGTKVLPTNHCVPVHDYRSAIRWDQNPLDKLLRFWSLRTADRIHVLFPTYATWFPEALQAKVVAIPNAVSPSFLEPVAPTKRQRRIVGVGRLNDVKNYGVLVEAWALLAAKYPDWSVEIYGSGPQRKELLARIQELSLEDSVHLMAHSNAIKQIYLESEIMVHPALFEGFGLSVAEALALGTPVVAFRDGAGVSELVHDGVNGLLVDREGGAQALAQGIERLITDEALRQELRARCRDSLHAYRPEIFRERWIGLVGEIVARARAERGEGPQGAGDAPTAGVETRNRSGGPPASGAEDSTARPRGECG
jgi:glycosyltransferase involved in cell wall biosynthesis